MSTILIAEFMDEDAVAQLRAAHPTLYDPQLVNRRADLLGLVNGPRALIVRNLTQVDRTLLERAPALRVIGRLGVGLDNIDVAACHARDIKVIPATGANADSVAEYVIIAIGALLRGAFLSTGEVAAGQWPRGRLSAGRELGGRLLGLIGFGDIGQRVARRAVALGMRVAAFDPALPADHPAWTTHGVGRTDLDALIGAADAVSLHVPLNEHTRNLISAERLARMRPDAVLVNTARGGIVDEAALAEVLRAGRLGGAALDVFAEEPLRPGSPLVGVPNLILTPHIAGVTTESNVRVSSMIAVRVLEALQ
ncbi:hydroxyacid dehydrogenase [Roseomonas chloroacetimidivorans]|uniref:hydroxyacid dehydrogenase n=1 Tax=Roseomonas chloroacetimidivorans TaxID=1766656 RepID=UPI003C726A35